MSDISNRELKETLIELKEFIKQTNVNVTKLNDNQIFHNQELIKLNEHLKVWTTLGNKLIPKIVWLITVLIAIILFMAGYTFLFDKIF